MSLLEFQQALSKLVLSPEFRALVREDATQALAVFDLTALEQRRLAAVARTRGIALGTMLHRARRLTTLANTLPRTCIVLAQDFDRMVEAYWQAHPPQNLYHEQEAARFGAFVLALLREGDLQNELLEEVVQMELSVLTLANTSQNTTSQHANISAPTTTFPYLEPRYRIAFFRHDPEPLLTALDKGVVPQHVQQGYYCLLLSRSANGQLQLQQINPHMGAILAACTGQHSMTLLCNQFSLTAENFAALAAHGYIVLRGSRQSAARP
jgi:hypothetical protein